jgi:proline dehydrogenase
MALLREPLLAAARSPRLRALAERSRLTRPVVRRFVAGTAEADAITAARSLVGSGLLVSLDFLGEDTTSAEQAERTVRAYESLLRRVAEAGLARQVEVSVKLSAIGQKLSGSGSGSGAAAAGVDAEAIVLAGARRICAAASAAGTTVTVDMEDHTTTDATLAVVRELRTEYPWVGTVLQAYLRRTEADCREFAGTGSRIRLCKGAYAEPESVAYTGADVEASYLRCLEILLDGAGYPMIATHDPAMLTAARAAVVAHGRAPDSYEFQMLFGVRPGEQRALAAEGHRLRVYTPYGDEWYGYFMRRLAERPANLALFLKALSSTK